MSFLDRLNDTVSGIWGAVEEPTFGIVKDLSMDVIHDPSLGGFFHAITNDTVHRGTNTLADLFGPDGAIGAPIGGLPDAARVPGRYTIKPVLDKDQWLYTHAVSHPFATLMTVGSLSESKIWTGSHGHSLGDMGVLFDPKAWGDAWDMTNHTSPGQAFAKNMNFAFIPMFDGNRGKIDIMNLGEVNKFEGSDWYKASSGIFDAFTRTYFDPLQVAGEYAGAARLAAKGPLTTGIDEGAEAAAQAVKAGAAPDEALRAGVDTSVQMRQDQISRYIASTKWDNLDAKLQQVFDKFPDDVNRRAYEIKYKVFRDPISHDAAAMLAEADTPELRQYVAEAMMGNNPTVKHIQEMKTALGERMRMNIEPQALMKEPQYLPEYHDSPLWRPDANPGADMDETLKAFQHNERLQRITGELRFTPKAQGRLGAIKAIPQTSQLYQSSPWLKPVRVFTNIVPTGLVDVADPNWIDQVQYNLRQAGMPLERQKEWVGRLAGAPTDQRINLIQEAEAEGLQIVADRHGVHVDDLNHLKAGAEVYRQATNDTLAASKNLGDHHIEVNIPFDGMGQEHVKVIMKRPGDYANAYPMTNFPAVERDFSQWKTFLDENGRAPKNLIDNSMKLWRAGVLLRPAWPMRIMAEHGMAMAFKMRELAGGSDVLMKGMKDYASWKKGFTNYWGDVSRQTNLAWGGGTGALFGGVVAGPIGMVAGGGLGAGLQLLGRNLNEIPYSQFMINDYLVHGAFGHPMDKASLWRELVSSDKDLQAAFGRSIPNQAYRATLPDSSRLPEDYVGQASRTIPEGFATDPHDLPGFAAPEGAKAFYHVTADVPEHLKDAGGYVGPTVGELGGHGSHIVVTNEEQAANLAEHLKVAAVAAKGMDHAAVARRFAALHPGVFDDPGGLVEFAMDQQIEHGTRVGDYLPQSARDVNPPLADARFTVGVRKYRGRFGKVRNYEDLGAYFKQIGATPSQMLDIMDEIARRRGEAGLGQIHTPVRRYYSPAAYAEVDPFKVGVVKMAVRKDAAASEVAAMPSEVRNMPGAYEIPREHLHTISEHPDTFPTKPELDDLNHTTIQPGHPAHLDEWERVVNEYIGQNPLARIIMSHEASALDPGITPLYAPPYIQDTLDFTDNYGSAHAGQMWLEHTPEGRAFAAEHPFHAKDPEAWVNTLTELIHQLTNESPEIYDKLLRGDKVTAQQMLRRFDDAELDQVKQVLLDRSTSQAQVGAGPGMSADPNFILSKNINPFIEPSHIPPQWLGKAIDKMYGQNAVPGEVQRIATDKIITHQNSVFIPRIMETLRGNTRELPEVVAVGDGRYMLFDGNHRLSTANLTGEKYITAKVWEGPQDIAAGPAPIAGTVHPSIIEGQPNIRISAGGERWRPTESPVLLRRGPEPSTARSDMIKALDAHVEHDPLPIEVQADANSVLDQLPSIHADFVKQVTGNSEKWKGLQDIVEQLFQVFGQMPLDHLINNQLFSRTFFGDMTQTLSGIERGIMDDGYIRNVEEAARGRALSQMRNLMYDFGNKSEFAQMVRTIMPFFPAYQQTLQRWAGLAIENPAALNKVRLALQAPGKMGLTWKDPQSGEEYVRLRLPSFASSILGHGFFKGALDDQGYVRFQTKGLTLAGEGLPGFGPWVDLALQPFVRDHPELADSMKFIYPYGVPDNFAQAFFPPNLQRAINVNDDDGRSFRAAYNRIIQTRLVKMQTGALPMLDLNDAEVRGHFLKDAHDEARSFQMMRWITGAFAPAALQYDSPYQVWIDKYRELLKQDPKTAQDKFLDEFGDQYFALTQAFTKLNNGVPSTVQGEADYAKYQNLIDRFPDLGSLIMGTQGGGSAAQFSAAAYAKQRRTPLRPGSDVMQRTALSPEEIVQQSDARLGWTKFTRTMDTLDATLAAMGAPNYNVKEATQLRVLKDLAIQAIGTEHPQWFQEYSQRDEAKWNNRIAAMKIIVKDERLKQRPDIEMLGNYLDTRDAIVGILGLRPSHGLNSESNSDLRDIWDTYVQQLKHGENGLAFSDMYSRWLDTDPLNQPGPTSIGAAA